MDYEMHSDPSREEAWQHMMERAEESIREVSHDEARNLFIAGCGHDADVFQNELLEGIDSVADKQVYFGSADEARVFLYCPAIDRGIWWGTNEHVAGRGKLSVHGRAALRDILKEKGFLLEDSE